MPLKIITQQVEQPIQQPIQWGVDTPAFRRVINNPERLQAAVEAQERHTESLLRDSGARGTAVGWDDNDNPVVKVYIDSGDSEAGIPETLDGIPVVVEYTGKLYALNIPCSDREGGRCDTGSAEDVTPVLQATAGEPGPKERQPRPVPIGVSAGHTNVTAGTLGCRVTAGCHTYALSNAHVFADVNDGVIGDNILQPGVYDGGLNPNDMIGTLAASVPIVLTESAYNRVDAAIVTTGASLVGRSTPSNGYGTPRYNALPATVNLNVMKYGRSSSMTYGYVDAVNATVIVEYGSASARFVGQIIIKPNSGADFSLPGDSGSLVVASGGAHERRPVGLLFAAGSGITAANPISNVLSELGIAIDGE